MKRIFVVVAALSAAACASEQAPTEDELAGESSLDGEAGKADDFGSTFTFFAVQRDYRKCAWPHCGGFYVSRVNRALTRCADGSWQDRCYVVSADLSGTGLSPSQVESATNLLGGGALVRGAIETYSELDFDNLARIAVTEVWPAETDAEADGVFVRVTDSGVRCITTPCWGMYHEGKLNSVLHASFDELDLSGSGADEDQIAKAFESLYTEDGIIVAGYRYWFRDKGWHPGRYATQFYRRMVPAPDAAECVVAGCSGQLCIDPATDPGITTCEWRDEYACYREATCARQDTGRCGWTLTPELEACLADPPAP